MVEETRDTELLSGFFNADPALYVYLLGDLDPFFFQATQWWVTRRDVVTSSLLLYTAFDTAVVVGLADNDDQGRLWETLLPDLPVRAHAHYRQQHEPILRRRYRVQNLGTHQRMQWNRETATLDCAPPGGGEVRVLSEADRERIAALYRAAYPGAFFDERTLGIGRTIGVFAGDELAAIAACHVYSRQYSVAAIGAVATHPEYRGRGFCTAATRALIELLADDVETIALNVHCENKSAIRIYERLGFERRHYYEEAIIEAVKGGNR